MRPQSMPDALLRGVLVVTFDLGSGWITRDPHSRARPVECGSATVSIVSNMPIAWIAVSPRFARFVSTSVGNLSQQEGGAESDATHSVASAIGGVIPT